MRHPGLLFGSVHLSRAAPGLTRSRFREAIRFHVWSYRLAVGRRLGPDILILDQGIIQEGWGLVVRETGLPAPEILAATKTSLPERASVTPWSTSMWTVTWRLAGSPAGAPERADSIP